MIFYFSTRVGERVVHDWEGSELPHMDAACAEAVLTAREMMADAIPRGRDISDGVFEIADEHQRIVAVVPFSAAVRRTA